MKLPACPPGTLSSVIKTECDTTMKLENHKILQNEFFNCNNITVLTFCTFCLQEILHIKIFSIFCLQQIPHKLLNFSTFCLQEVPHIKTFLM